MAELSVQRKKNSSWIWVVIVLVLIAGAAIYFVMNNNNEIINGTDPAAVGTSSDTIAPVIP